MTSKFIAEYLHLMPDVFEGVNSLKDLQNKIQKMAGHPNYSHFAGFLWEYVVAMYFYKFGEHHTVNVCDYRQTYAGSHGDDADYGLDGYGETFLGNPILCQVKYRSSKNSKIGKEKNQKPGALDTFVNEICRNLSLTDKQVIVLLCSTTNEFSNLKNSNAMQNLPFSKMVIEKLKERGTSVDRVIFRVYDFQFWEIWLKNVRFWNFVRSDTQCGQ